MDADPRPDPTPPADVTPLAASAAPPGLPALEPAPLIAPRVRALLEVIACSGFPTQIVIGVLVASIGLGPTSETGALSLRGLAILLALDSIAILALVWWFLVAGGESPARVLVGTRHWLGEVLLGFWLLPALFGLVILVGLTVAKLAPWLRPPDNPLGALLDSSQDAAVLALIGLLAGGVREEVQRAFILHRFERHLGGATVGLICFSLLFGLGHVLQGWAAVLTTTLLGAFWGYVYLRRRSIVAPMVSHALFNLIQTLVFRLHG